MKMCVVFQLAMGTCCLAQDVHVRVAPGAASASPGDPNAMEGRMTSFPTIQNALTTIHLRVRAAGCSLRLLPGTDHERIIVTQNHQDVTLVGMGKTPEETAITNSLNAKSAGGTFFTETAELNGDRFEADT